MSEALEVYEIRADAGLLGAQEELEDFKDLKKSEAATIVAHGVTAARWASDASQMKAHMERVMREQRKEMYA
jgi:hypothetical protein